MTRAEVYSGFSILMAAILTVFFGFTGAASVQAASISTTGPDSKNIISSVDWDECEIINKNDVNVDSFNNQKAITGKAVVAHNTKGGNATSGDAKNTNSTNVSIDIKNNSGDQLRWCDTDGDGVGDAVISKTGPHSYNKISRHSSSKVKVYNDNDIDVHNTHCQRRCSSTCRGREWPGCRNSRPTDRRCCRGAIGRRAGGSRRGRRTC